MINRFGLYGCNITDKLKDTIKKYKKVLTKSDLNLYFSNKK